MYSVLVKCGPKRGYLSRGETGFISIELYFTCGKLSPTYRYLKIVMMFQASIKYDANMIPEF
jgi:hypothetical protein